MWWPRRRQTAYTAARGSKCKWSKDKTEAAWPFTTQPWKSVSLPLPSMVKGVTSPSGLKVRRIRLHLFMGGISRSRCRGERDMGYSVAIRMSFPCCMTSDHTRRGLPPHTFPTISMGWESEHSLSGASAEFL